VFLFFVSELSFDSIATVLSLRPEVN